MHISQSGKWPEGPTRNPICHTKSQIASMYGWIPFIPSLSTPTIIIFSHHLGHSHHYSTILNVEYIIIPSFLFVFEPTHTTGRDRRIDEAFSQYRRLNSKPRKSKRYGHLCRNRPLEPSLLAIVKTHFFGIPKLPEVHGISMLLNIVEWISVGFLWILMIF